MQTSYESDFVVRLLEYGFGLRYDGIKIKEDENKQDQNALQDLSENIIETLKNPPVEVYAINLPYEIKKLSNNKPLIFNKKKLDKTRVEWIKLLGLRHWTTRDEHPLYHKYIISFQKNTGDSNNIIQSAIRILEMINERDLKEFIKNKSILLRQIKGAEEEGNKKKNI
ncbi:hypothetical protein LY90DRAFT_669073 [Neocallimastix californiae]|uniref:Uncharacterized protein n=1 Tax=Neocallimastix californiae TaxID=1754190 RepID=A0A1Y2DGW7_9FUNG|nr:hypothetical protein LY90DRAFT_669073 [Neocallimastix californiae]|eukprot:ORY58324.1 hypothetical protein LY90DRAFT_669073 [Neocallimastix californiae]